MADGAQFGANVNFGYAESAEFITAPAYVQDIDLLAFSVAYANNDPLYAVGSSPGDSQVRLGMIGFGPGAGASRVLTRGWRTP